MGSSGSSRKGPLACRHHAFWGGETPFWRRKSISRCLKMAPYTAHVSCLACHFLMKKIADYHSFVPQLSPEIVENSRGKKNISWGGDLHFTHILEDIHSSLNNVKRHLFLQYLPFQFDGYSNRGMLLECIVGLLHLLEYRI